MEPKHTAITPAIELLAQEVMLRERLDPAYFSASLTASVQALREAGIDEATLKNLYGSHG